MTKNSSKHYQLVSAENDLTNTDVKESTFEDGHQNKSSCNNYEDKAFCNLCKENGEKNFQHSLLEGKKMLNKFCFNFNSCF